MSLDNLDKKPSITDFPIPMNGSIHDGHVSIDAVEFPRLAAMTAEERTALEKKLRWKIDLRMLPMLILIYIMNYLDRSVLFSSYHRTSATLIHPNG